MSTIAKAALASLFAVSILAAQSTSTASVERLDPALDALVSPDARVELVKGGFGFTESLDFHLHHAVLSPDDVHVGAVATDGVV